MKACLFQLLIQAEKYYNGRNNQEYDNKHLHSPSYSLATTPCIGLYHCNQTVYDTQIYVPAVKFILKRKNPLKPADVRNTVHIVPDERISILLKC
jgi:hypothetical protein